MHRLRRTPLLALVVLHGIEEAITPVYPEACVVAYADACLVLHPDRSVLEHCQQLVSQWLAGIGLTLNTSTTRISHTLRESTSHTWTLPRYEYPGTPMRMSIPRGG